MIDVHPPHHPAHTWRGFALRVVIIALAALIVLGVASLLGWTSDTLAPAPVPTKPVTPTQPS